MSISKRTEKFFVAEPGFGTNLQSLQYRIRESTFERPTM
jgi:hypothetical protein